MGIDFVSRDDLQGMTCVLNHVRFTCLDLQRSTAWYAQIGFEPVHAPTNVEIPGAAFVSTGPRRRLLWRACDYLMNRPR